MNPAPVHLVTVFPGERFPSSSACGALTKMLVRSRLYTTDHHLVTCDACKASDAFKAAQVEAALADPVAQVSRWVEQAKRELGKISK